MSAPKLLKITKKGWSATYQDDFGTFTIKYKTKDAHCIVFGFAKRHFKGLCKYFGWSK